MKKIDIEKCPCGHEKCRYYFLKGIGSFYQGTGFNFRQAKRIAELINKDKDFSHDL